MKLADLIVQKNPNVKEKINTRNHGEATTQNDLKRAQTFSFNQMKSTLKMDEFKMRLQMEGILTSGKSVDDNSPKKVLNSNVFIRGNDWEVIVWGWKCNTVKISSAISTIYEFI